MPRCLSIGPCPVTSLREAGNGRPAGGCHGNRGKHTGGWKFGSRPVGPFSEAPQRQFGLRAAATKTADQVFMTSAKSPLVPTVLWW